MSANASAAATRKTPRRLEDVSIEGEVPVPQVLFVTAREQRRGIEFQQHRYLPTARALGQATPLPRWIATPQNPPPSR
jgi:stringent starvation protein B